LDGDEIVKEAIDVKLEERTLRVHAHGNPAPRTPERRPVALWLLLGLMGFLTIGALVGGISFIADPTGAGLGVKQSWLEQTPVSDYFLPGLFLLAVYAIGSAILMAGLAWRLSPGPLRRIDRRIGFHWSWAGTILVGAVLVGWILYQFAVIPETIALQPILIGVGILMMAIPLLPSMRRYYATGSRKRV
jgi:hypothetical protein